MILEEIDAMHIVQAQTQLGGITKEILRKALCSEELSEDIKQLDDISKLILKTIRQAENLEDAYDLLSYRVTDIAEARDVIKNML